MANNKAKGRFAPSPSGRMHLGNLWYIAPELVGLLASAARPIDCPEAIFTAVEKK